MRSYPEARPFLPSDIPLVRRLTPHGVSLDSAITLTRGVHTIEGAVWGSVPLADLGTPTFVARVKDVDAVAQFRHKAGDQHAHIVYIAPDLDRCEDTLWLNLLDAMVIAAGRRGAVTLNAEVDENSNAFVVLRQAGYAVYARQEIWKREPAPYRAPTEVETAGLLRAETEQDTFGIHCLYASIMPRLVLQADAPPETGRGGLVYEHDDQVLAYVTVQEGKCGIYVQSFIHPEAYDRAKAILAAAISHLPRADRLPVYFCVRRYQDWLGSSLEELGFMGWASQAVMVKHTATRVEQSVFKPVHSLDVAVHVLPRSPTKWIYREPVVRKRCVERAR